MYYITMQVKPTLPVTQNARAAFDFLYGITDRLDLREGIDYIQTYTKAVQLHDLPAVLASYPSEYFSTLITKIRNFKQNNPDTTRWYSTFYVPKRSGGMRKISAPIESLKEIQRDIANTLQHMPGYYPPVVHPHNAAYAYIKGRSTIDAITLHQQNNSNWFLKLDMKNFFPSCTTLIVKQLLKKVYPLNFIEDSVLDELLSVCTLDDALPQGSAASPLLTNLLMVPIDKAISDLTYNYNRRHVVYTRYADDILLSAKESFDWRALQEEIKTIIEREGFKLNTTKTRYGSKAGSNWNLGIMLNKDNNMTLGHKHKQRMRAALFNFLSDAANGNLWSREDTYVLTGQLSYMHSIEPEYTEHIIAKYENKININYKQTVKIILGV